MLIAGEVSGDALGGRLMAALRERWDGDVRFTGVGGEQMAAEGLLSLFPMSELSVMGLAEVLPRLPGLLRRIVEVASFAREAQPDVLVTIDAPSFGLRVARRLGGAGIPLVHYVAPQLWAWRPSRARRIARTVDRLLALLPFEPEFFARYGVPCSFVGHPVVELPYETPEDGVAFREEFGIPADAETLLVLPGSRQSETARLLPVFGGTIKRLAVARPELQVIVATLPSVEDDVRAAVASWPLPVHLVTRRQHRFGAFATADVALAASGTV
ncbi:MAG TPA: lipid-A-disaccharide synthase, partial [Alphaproteobacteria bacterium]|nr:lipid-A-disaccharide synthase [Alphaproteobacteria bacterium]